MITAEHIELSIQRALQGQSNLSQAQLQVRGFSTPTIRRLFSNLCNLETGTYLEVGLYCGGTFVSAFNPGMICIGIEDHSQDFSAGFDVVKRELQANVDAFSDRAKEVYVHYTDCFKMDLSVIPNNIDIFMYDGEHGYESQRKAFSHFLEKFSDRFLVIIDDAAWEPVARGNDDGLRDIADRVIVEAYWPLRGVLSNNDPIWHNGVNLYLMSKRK